jgi:hypothetical protein
MGYAESLIFNGSDGAIIKALCFGNDSLRDIDKKLVEYLKTSAAVKKVINEIKKNIESPKMDAKKLQYLKTVLQGYIREARKGN